MSTAYNVKCPEIMATTGASTSCYQAGKGRGKGVDNLIGAKERDTPVVVISGLVVVTVVPVVLVVGSGLVVVTVVLVVCSGLVVVTVVAVVEDVVSGLVVVTVVPEVLVVGSGLVVVTVVPVVVVVDSESAIMHNRPQALHLMMIMTIYTWHYVQKGHFDQALVFPSQTLKHNYCTRSEQHIGNSALVEGKRHG